MHDDVPAQGKRPVRRDRPRHSGGEDHVFETAECGKGIGTLRQTGGSSACRDDPQIPHLQPDLAGAGRGVKHCEKRLIDPVRIAAIHAAPVETEPVGRAFFQPEAAPLGRGKRAFAAVAAQHGNPAAPVVERDLDPVCPGIAAQFEFDRLAGKVHGVFQQQPCGGAHGWAVDRDLAAEDQYAVALDGGPASAVDADPLKTAQSGRRIGGDRAPAQCAEQHDKETFHPDPPFFPAGKHYCPVRIAGQLWQLIGFSHVIKKSRISAVHFNVHSKSTFFNRESFICGRKPAARGHHVAKSLRLTRLAPEIVHTILTGNLPGNFSVDCRKQALPVSWLAQKKLLGIE